MTDEELRKKVARAFCQSRKFETGQGGCAPLCMQMLGDARSGPHGCDFAHEILGDLADRAIALCREHYGAEVEWLRRERDEARVALQPFTFPLARWGRSVSCMELPVAPEWIDAARAALRKEEDDD